MQGRTTHRGLSVTGPRAPSPASLAAPSGPASQVPLSFTEAAGHRPRGVLSAPGWGPSSVLAETQVLSPLDDVQVDESTHVQRPVGHGVLQSQPARACPPPSAPLAGWEGAERSGAQASPFPGGCCPGGEGRRSGNVTCHLLGARSCARP